MPGVEMLIYIIAVIGFLGSLVGLAISKKALAIGGLVLMALSAVLLVAVGEVLL